MARALLRPLKLLLPFTVVARALSIDWPPTIVQDSQASITWHGDAPFNFAVFSADRAANSTEQIFKLLNTNDTQVQWSANVASGTIVFFFVSDSTAAFVQSDDVVISSPNGSGSTTTTAPPSTSPASTAQSTATSSATPTSSSTPSTTSTSTPTTSSSASAIPPTTTSPLPEHSTPSPTQSAYTQPSMSADKSIPYIVGVISGIVALVIIVVGIRFFFKRHRRRQQAATLAARQMTYWNPKPDNKGDFDMEKAGSSIVAKEKEKESLSHENVVSSDRISGSSEEPFVQRNAAGSILPLHATPVGSYSPQPPSGPAHPSLGAFWPMLPNPYPENNVQNKGSTRSKNYSIGKSSRNSETLTNARASSVFLPLNDQYEATEVDAGPSTSGAHALRPVTQAQPHVPPSSWKAGQIVSQHGELVPSPTSTNAPKSAHPVYGQSSSRSANTARTNSSNGRGTLLSSLTSRGSAPASPSPFDDVVFDLGGLPPQTITPLGRTVSTKTTRVHRRIGNNNVPSGERSPAVNFPSDADDEVDDFEYDLPTPSTRSVTRTTRAWLREDMPPVPPLNIGKVSADASRQQHHRSAIPSPPHDSAGSEVADSPTVPMTPQSDGDYVRSMFADVFGPGVSHVEHGQGQEPSLPTPKPTVTSAVNSAHGDPDEDVSASQTNLGSPSRRPRPNWI